MNGRQHVIIAAIVAFTVGATAAATVLQIIQMPKPSPANTGIPVEQQSRLSHALLKLRVDSTMGMDVNGLQTDLTDIAMANFEARNLTQAQSVAVARVLSDGTRLLRFWRIEIGGIVGRDNYEDLLPMRIITEEQIGSIYKSELKFFDSTLACRVRNDCDSATVEGHHTADRQLWQAFVNAGIGRLQQDAQSAQSSLVEN